MDEEKDEADEKELNKELISDDFELSRELEDLPV